MGTIIILIVLAILTIWVVGIYNALIKLRNAVRNGWAQIDVQLKRRHDLIPNLVSVVKDYMSYEQETLQKVVEARSNAINAKGVEAIGKAENQLTGALKSLFAVFEQYPDLKANQNALNLQEELTTTENKIAFARQYYNDSVMRLNNRIEMFPSNVIAQMFNFKHEVYLEIESEARNVPKVSLRD